MTRSFGALLAALLLLLALPNATAGMGTEGGLLVRAEGDVTIGPNETLETLVLTGEETRAHVAGTVGVVVVIGGTLDLTGTVRDQVVLIDAHAILHNGSHVQGDISSFDATVDRQAGAQVDGTIERGSLEHFGSLATIVFGIIFLLGIPVALLAAALLAVAFFPRQVRTVGHTLTTDPGSSLIAAAILWFGVPFVAFLLFFTLVGIPLALGLTLILLPLLWLGGFIAAGVRLGDLMLSGWGKRPLRTHPYRAALLGVLLLVLIALLPIVGALAVLLAGMIGAGSLVLAAWRAAPRWGRRAPPAGPATRTPGAEEAPCDPGAGGA